MNFEADWELLRAGIPDLPGFLLSKGVFWPLRLTAHTPGSMQVPQLTIGSLRLSLERLSALPLSAENQKELDLIAQQVRQVRQDWRANWGQKAEQEQGARLRLWRQYLSDLREDPRSNVAAYPTQVRQRAILQLLGSEGPASASPQIQIALDELDALLHKLTLPGSFAWEPAVMSAFPESGFWFLYVFPRK